MSPTVILIAYHGDRWLPACLSSLAQASTHSLHLVLADNAGNSILDSLDLAAFDVEVLPTPRSMGFAEANNFALIGADRLRDTVLFLNQDTISPAHWIDRCTDVLDDHSDLGAVSPLIRTYEADGWDPSFMACLSDTQKRMVRRGTWDGPVLYTENAPAPALLVRTDVLRQAGPFDPVFGSYYEDYDLCRRIRDLGYKIGFATEARVRHFSGGSTTTEAQERRRMRQVIRNRMLYELREGDTSRWRAFLGRVLRDFPHRLARGLLNTPSSQPPSVTLKAYVDVLRLGRRFVSSTYDEQQWRTYLHSIGWPPAPPASAEESSTVSDKHPAP